MSFFWECVVGTLAAVGLICILKAVYDIIVTEYITAGLSVELFVYGDGYDPRTVRLLQTLARLRGKRMPGLEIFFIERRTGKIDGKILNYAAVCAEQYAMIYINQEE